jgi:PAS domain S-box-containing protein
MDTLPEDAYDEITDLVSRMLDVPVCLISFVEAQRLWFKARKGMDLQELPREPSFCHHAIQSEDDFIIPNALKDDRFKDFPTVNDSAGIRFYAGIPLKSSDGFTWGVLCVMDTKPRELCERELALLKYFSRRVVQLVEQRASRIEFQETKQWASSIVEDMLDGVISLDHRGRIKSLNSAAERIFGYSGEEIKNDSVSKLVPDVFENLFDGKASAHTTRQGKKPHCFKGEFCGRHKNGADVLIEASVYDFSYQGRRMFTGIFRDLTEKQNAENTMRRAFALLDGTMDGIFMFHPETLIFSYVNKGAVLQTGYSEEELLKMSPLDINPVFDEKRFRELLSPLLMNECPALKFTTVHQLKNGEEMPVEIVLQHLKVSANRSHLICIVRDITERVRAEHSIRQLNSNLELLIKERTQELERANQALSDSEERFRALFESSRDGIVVGGAQMEFILCNAEFERLTGYTREELVELKFLDAVIHPEDREKLLINNRRRFKGETFEWRYEFRIQTKTGEIRHVDACFNLATSGDRVIGIQGVCRDISDRKLADKTLQILNQELEQRVEQRTRDLEEARALAERANQAKSAFLSRMSHEVRTPLSGILGFSKLLEMSELNEVDSKNARRIRSAGEHLLELVDEVLDISRIESGNLSLSLKRVDLSVLTHEVIDLMETLSRSSAISIHFENKSGPATYVWADHKRLRQVLINLASNGIKFNREGGTLTFTILSAKKNRLRLEVRDTGIGIPSEKMYRLFSPFERLDAEKRQPSVSGTGLGLALCKVLLESMDGKISVVSNEKEGSVFSVELPRAEEKVHFNPNESNSSRKHTKPASEESLSPLKVLYIEDKEDNLELFEQVVQLSDHATLYTAVTGEAGMKLAIDCQPDLVFLDFHLPDCEGDVVLTKLKEHERTKYTPIYILSADARNEQIQRLKKLGAVDYLVKPFDIERLLEIIESHEPLIVTEK